MSCRWEGDWHYAGCNIMYCTFVPLLRVLSDIHTATDRQDVTLLGLLDLSTSFDCVDHDILVDLLQQSFGICGVALTWIRSFLHGRTRQVSYAGVLSTLMVLTFGVPQGSVLGPLLFLLYTAELFDVIASAGLTAHSYADDTQVYISTPATSSSTTVRWAYWCLDEQQPAEDECPQNAAAVAWNQAATE